MALEKRHVKKALEKRQQKKRHWKKWHTNNIGLHACTCIGKKARII
jgi:hypothetical protein